MTRPHVCPAMRLVLMLALTVARPAGGSGEEASGDPQPDRAVRERAFAEQLSGATLVGLFTVDGREDAKPPEPERYELGKVTKVEGRQDDWRFEARIQYAQYDVKVPLVLKVFWADDTPVIALTDFAVPGLGTFTARVMFHQDRYVGTWQHGETGGHMYGRIERADTTASEDAAGTPKK